jgi:LuxR family transcriptional regulator, maltose regulon positive regulatory protein
VLERGEGITELLRSTPGEGVLREYVDGLLLAAQTSAGGTPRVAPDALEALSSRERTVLRLLASRLTSQEIASTLFISPNTLKTHTKNIYRKLGATTRSEAVRLSSSGH